MAPRARRRPACARRSMQPDRGRWCARCCARARAAAPSTSRTCRTRSSSALMRGGHHEVARAYVLYRERRRRSAPSESAAGAALPTDRAACDRSSERVRRSTCARLQALIESACAGLAPTSSPSADHGRDDGATCTTACRSTRCYKACDPGRAHADREGSRLHAAPPRACCCTRSARKIWARMAARPNAHTRYADYFPRFIKKGVAGRAARRDAAAVTTWSRWAPRSSPSATCSSTTSACRRCTTATSCTCAEARIELPQAFFMRVAMGLALNESRPRSARHRVLRRAVDLRLHVARRRRCSTPARCRSQLSTLLPHRPCRTTSTASTRRSRRTRCCPSSPAAWATTGRRCARSARTSRAPTAESQGVVPFLKVVNDTAVAVNQGGKRKGAVCAQSNCGTYSRAPPAAGSAATGRRSEMSSFCIRPKL